MTAQEREAFERTVRLANLGARNPVRTWPPRQVKRRKSFRPSKRFLFACAIIGYLIGLFLPKFF